MLKIVLASNNPGKMTEIQHLLEDASIELVSQQEFQVPEVVETGTTFVENAIIKARHAARYSGLPAVADDSGLVVPALGGAPGVYSARYAGPDASDRDRIEHLLKALEETPNLDRSAFFHCVAAFMKGERDPAPIICHGVWEGEILSKPHGERGFGYDPIFYVPTHRCSAAELSSSEKNCISHRGQAFSEFVAYLRLL